MRGRASHGLLRLPRIIERIHNGVADPNTRGKAVWRAPAFLDMDGERGLGPVIALAALDRIRGRARETGIAVAAVSNNNHIGMLALYAEQVAREGQILLALSTSECTPSLSMAALPLIAAATNLMTAMAMLPASAAYTTLCEEACGPMPAIPTRGG